ncbi:MAG TPA: LpqB family beta-propeller domain-containing protein [Vicinamibacteria bacterium]|nr:LpqB family beta-propeller domain-containing protein [Vicinamibacteria bacterium]
MVRIASSVLILSGLAAGAMAQTRLEFHMLPAVSTGPLDPDWSPDGAFIAFAMRGDIWKVPANGGEAVALTEGPGYYYEPSISPDGTEIAVVIEVDGDFELGLIPTDGGTVRRLTHREGLDLQPSWSADGTSLYFTSHRERDLDIYRYDLASGHTSLVVSRRGHDFHPAVSPDGTRLAFVSPVEGRLGSGGIWVMALPEGEPELVHYEETSYRPKPAWSPDGTRLVYISDAAGSNDIAVIPATGGNRIRLTEDPLDELDVTFSHNGSRVAFVSNHEGPTLLYTLSSDGGARSARKRVAMPSRRARVATGRLRGRVVAHDGETTPARILLRASDGRAYAEDGGFQRLSWTTGTHYFHTTGTFDVEVPAGEVAVEAMRGFEFVPAGAQVVVPAGGTIEVSLELDRLIDAPAEGWYSGDTHTHDLHEGRFGLTQDSFFAQLVADDVHVTNALIHMDGTKLMGRWTDLTGEPDIRSTKDHILYYTQEFRGSYGHVALLGLDRFIMPLIGGAPSTPYSADVLKLRHLDAAREQGGIGGFVHPYNAPVGTPSEASAADIPVHVALGRGEFFDVISIASLEQESAAMYYRLLNCGFRIAASGGTDNFSDVYRDPSGGTARTYAHIEGPLEYRAWLEAVKAGRTFATSGPLLFLTVDGKSPGDTIERGEGDPAALKATLRVFSIAPLEKVDIVVNGEIARSFPVEAERNRVELETDIELSTSGWVAAQAMGPPSKYVGDAFPFAQTSPVYVVRGGAGYESAEDARFLLATVDELWQRVQARDSLRTEEERREYRDAIDRARAVYRSIIARAETR